MESRGADIRSGKGDTGAGRASGRKLQPPLTPMIDMTFQLLLFFLLTTTFRQAEGKIPGSLPAAGGIAAAATVRLEPIRIALIPTGSERVGCIYRMSGHHVTMGTPRQLYEALAGRKRALASSRVPVVIEPRPDVRWQYVVEAFNQAVRAEFKSIGFAAAQ